MKKLLTTLFALLTLAATTALPALADGHPGYLHALSDLRLARALVSRDNPGPRDHYVVEEIDHAIDEIKTASIDDGKHLDDHPPIDANLDFHGRFHRALDLLDHAHHDVNQFEDNSYAQGLQHRALYHIDKAHHEVENILHNW